MFAHEKRRKGSWKHRHSQQYSFNSRLEELEVRSLLTNLITNGNFEAGNTGFSTDYYFSSSIYDFRQYTITRDPRLAHNQAASFGDHTSGSGFMMAVNGPRSETNLTVWSETVTVSQNMTYTFATWVASWSDYPPELNALLDFSINGQSLGTFRAPSPAGIWREFSSAWDSGSSTSASIRIVVTNPGEFIANDFALDDVSLSGAAPDLAATPPTWNTADGGVDFGFTISRADLPHPPDIALYWASETTADTIMGNPIGSPTASKTTQGSSESFHVSPGDLGTPPQGAKYLLDVVNPPGDNHIQESDEANEQNDVLSLVVPDILRESARPKDAKSITISYEIDNADLVRPFNVAIWRSRLKHDMIPFDPQNFDPNNDVQVNAQQIPPTDEAGNSASALGHHVVKLPLQDGLPIDPSHPYVFTVLNPDRAVVETDFANDTMSFTKHVIGVVTHGFELPVPLIGGFPPWVNPMHDALVNDGYDKVIAFDWSDESGLPASGVTLYEGQKLASMVVDAAQEFDADDVVDVHFIGHSRGAVVNNEALKALYELQRAHELPSQLQASYLKETMLDPHPANAQDTFYSASPTPEGWLAVKAAIRAQAAMQDPDVIAPPNVANAEVYYQHTPWYETPNNGFEFIFINLQGELPAGNTMPPCNLTGFGVGHEEVHDEYMDDVVPSLGSASGFTCPDPPPLAGKGQSTSAVGLLYPQVVDNLGAANALVAQLAAAQAAYERGDSKATAGILNGFRDFVQVQRGIHITADIADDFIALATLFIEDLDASTVGGSMAAGGQPPSLAQATGSNPTSGLSIVVPIMPAGSTNTAMPNDLALDHMASDVTFPTLMNRRRAAVINA